MAKLDRPDEGRGYPTATRYPGANMQNMLPAPAHTHTQTSITRVKHLLTPRQGRLHRELVLGQKQLLDRGLTNKGFHCPATVPGQCVKEQKTRDCPELSLLSNNRKSHTAHAGHTLLEEQRYLAMHLHARRKASSPLRQRCQPQPLVANLVSAQPQHLTRGTLCCKTISEKVQDRGVRQVNTKRRAQPRTSHDVSPAGHTAPDALGRNKTFIVFQRAPEACLDSWRRERILREVECGCLVTGTFRS
mgnify:CR=1 FL=1